MEHHGKQSIENVIAVIPARYSSTRLPDKMLADVWGQPLIVRTYEQVRKAASIARVLVATDSDRIAEAIRTVGGEAVMTSSGHVSGSDRIAAVARDLNRDAIIVNVQGDEPLISPDTIDRAVHALIDAPEADMATVWEPVTSGDEIIDPNIVKVVCDGDGYALYFSRSPVPFPRDAASAHGGDIKNAIRAGAVTLDDFRKHVGLYVYRREFLLRFADMKPSTLERIEVLEQLRAIENGARIKVVRSAASSIGVDSAHDLERVRRIFAHHG